MTLNRKLAMLNKISSSISTHGYHVTVVQGGPLPQFAYTTGLHATAGFEIVFAGATFYTFDEMLAVVKEFARRMGTGHPLNLGSQQIEGLGMFSLRTVDVTWVKKMMLGPLSFYSLDSISAFQIIPSEEYWTIDIPNMEDSWNPTAYPSWQWLDSPWQYSVSPKSMTVTNLAALRGDAITEAMRWEESQWEIFSGAGPEVDARDVRIVPLGTILGYDPTLECVATLPIGGGCWRPQEGGEWHPWGK